MFGGNNAEVAIIVMARDEASRIFGQVGKGAGKMEKEVEKSAKGFQLLSAQQSKALKTMKPLGVAMAGLSAAGTALIGTSTMVAARNEELGLVLKVVGRNAGYTQQQLEDYEDATKGMGITTSKARQSLVQMVQAEIDLAHASDLARLSQDAAVIAQMDSSEAFNHLITTIQRGDPIMARTLGLAVDFNGAYKEMAGRLGKSAQALTAQEKVQARTNEVMRAGEGIAGSYEAAMGSAGKQMRSLNRHWEEAQSALGEQFLPMLAVAVGVATDALKAFNDLDESQKRNVASALGMGTAATGAAGGFVLLAPKVADTVAAMTALGVSGLTIVPVLLAVAATAAAVYKVVEFSAEVHAEHAEASNALAEMLAKEAAAGKDAAQIAEAYGDAVGRMRDEVDEAVDSNNVLVSTAATFVDTNKIVQGSLKSLDKTLVETSDTYEEYVEAKKEAIVATLDLAENQELLIDTTGEMTIQTTSLQDETVILCDELGNYITVTQEAGTVAEEHAGKLQHLTEEEWEAARAAGSVAGAAEEGAGAMDGAAGSASGLEAELKGLIADAEETTGKLLKAGEAASTASGYFGGLASSATELGGAMTEGVPGSEDMYKLLLETGRAAGMNEQEIGDLALALGVASEAEVQAQQSMYMLAAAWEAGELGTQRLAIEMRRLDEATRKQEEATSLLAEAEEKEAEALKLSEDARHGYAGAAAEMKEANELAIEGAEEDVEAKRESAEETEAWAGAQALASEEALKEAEALREQAAALEEQASKTIAGVAQTAKFRYETGLMKGTIGEATGKVATFADAGERVTAAYKRAAAAVKGFRSATEAMGAMGTPSLPPTGLHPGLQYGGPAMAGRGYIVGERGPELFVPFRSGTIVPNQQLVSQSTTHNYDVNIHSAAPTASWQSDIEFAQMLA